MKIPKNNKLLGHAKKLRHEMTPQERKLRSAYLESLGLQVIRYSNADINARFESVCEDIDRHIPCKF